MTTGRGALLAFSALAACARHESLEESAPSVSSAEALAELRAAVPELPSALTGPATSMNVETAQLAQAKTSERLAHAVTLPASECPRAHVLRDRICELAEHICHAGGSVAEVKMRCDSSSSQCEQAKEHVSGQCRP